MATNAVINPYQYFQDFNKGRPIFNGMIYVGKVGLDPEVIANQKDVTFLDACDCPVNTVIMQPIRTSSGGVPIYNGSPIRMFVEGSYSLKVNDSKGIQVYYSPDVTSGIPVTVDDAVTTIDTIALLRAYEPSLDGQQINLLGHTTAGIGGGGFYFDALDVSSIDNDGTIIVTPLGKRWKRTINESFLAEWFGVDKSIADNYASIIKAYDAADLAKYDCLWLPSNGGKLTITNTIPLKRGIAIRGGSTIDDQSGTVIKRANNMDVPVMATPKWFTPGATVAASYFVVEGITIDGNRDNQTVLQPALAFWDVFVGTVIDNVFVLNNYGPMLSNEYAFDLNIGLLYGNGCVVGSGAVWEIEQKNIAGGPIGLIEAESVYIENPRVTIGGGIPQTDKANRGEGIRVGNIGRIHISNLHQEACDVNVHITHGTNEVLMIDARSSAHSGDPARLNNDIYLSAGITNLQLGATKVFTPDAAYGWIGMTAGVKASNLYPTVLRTQTRWAGCNLSSPAADDYVTTGLRMMSDVEQRKINAQSGIQFRSYISETNDDLYYFDTFSSGIKSMGSKVNQASEVVFEKMNSLGGTSNNMEDLVPRKIVNADTTNVSSAFFITTADQLRIKIAGVDYNVTVTAV